MLSHYEIWTGHFLDLSPLLDLSTIETLRTIGFWKIWCDTGMWQNVLAEKIWTEHFSDFSLILDLSKTEL